MRFTAVNIEIGWHTTDGMTLWPCVARIRDERNGHVLEHVHGTQPLALPGRCPDFGGAPVLVFTSR